MLFQRFLVYSMRSNRPVRVLMNDDRMRYMNLIVLSMNDDSFIALRPGRKNPITVPYDQILAVSYARGDNGDTSKELFQA